MYYSASTDPSGQPWTAASVTREINRLAYEQFRVGNLTNTAAVCGNIVTSRGIETGPVDEDACQKLEAGMYEQLGEIEVMQRELQAIAANIAQPGTPSVIGPGAVNVVENEETGELEFVTTPTITVAPPNGSGATLIIPEDTGDGGGGGGGPVIIEEGPRDGNGGGGPIATEVAAGVGTGAGLGLLLGGAAVLWFLSQRKR